MYLKLIGHDYRYAVEQILLTLFPDERPQYEQPDEDCCAYSSLSVAAHWATSRTVLTCDGVRAVGISRVAVDRLSDPIERDRLLQRILKQSFYKAAVACTGVKPPWGALSGIRPAKLASRALREGSTEGQVRRLFRDEFYVSPERIELALDAARAGLAAAQRLESRDISLYVGIPFCPSRCVYCSFVSTDVQRTFQLVAPYLAALHREIDAAAAAVAEAGCSVRTLYIGGGTPTTLTASQLSELFDHLQRAFDFSHLAEFTAEAGRPDTITAEKLNVLKTAGADRISVNPQSMRTEVLDAIGRSHSAADISQAYAMVRESGIPIINMDLIAGLPQDHPSGFRYSLENVLSLRPENITVHTLALKKGSRLVLEKRNLPDGAAVAAMLDFAESTLRMHGYQPYYLYRQKYMSGAFENVGWCLPGTEGLYNLCIMEELHTILALGAGGSTKLTDPESGKIIRLTNPKYPQQYIERIDSICDNKAKLISFQQNLKTGGGLNGL